MKKFVVVTYVMSGDKVILKSRKEIEGTKEDAKDVAADIYAARGMYQGGQEKIHAFEIGSADEMAFRARVANVKVVK